MVETEPGVLWIGTLNGGPNLYIPNERERGGRFQHFKHQANDPNSLCSNTISGILADSGGRVWVETGAVEINGGGEIKRARPDNVLSGFFS